MGQVAVLSLTAALNPTLIVAATLMMLLPSPVKLMLGYLLGALMTSVTLGLVIAFTLSSSGAVSTAKKTLSPAADIALGLLALIVAPVLLGTARGRLARRETGRKRDKKDPRWKRAMTQGSPRTTFVIGALLTLPGASYLAGLHTLAKLHYSTAAVVLIVIGFNMVMLALLEVPLICFALAPNWTPGAIARAKIWVGAQGPRLAARGFAVIGLLLIIKGILELLR